MFSPRVFVDQPLAAQAIASLPAAAAHHLLRVLRLRDGDTVVLFDGRGGEYHGVLDTAAHDTACVRIERHEAVERESPLRITLAQGISRGERMDYTVQKAVELGVERIVPVQTDRSVVRLAGPRADKRLRHWREIACAAAEQCGRTRVPQIEPVQTLSGWLEQASQNTMLKLLLNPQAKTGLHDLPSPTTAVYLLIGPESGFTATEVEAASSAGFRGIHLGKRILRTETAGVACLAVLQALWGDL